MICFILIWAGSFRDSRRGHNEQNWRELKPALPWVSCVVVRYKKLGPSLVWQCGLVAKVLALGTPRSHNAPVLIPAAVLPVQLPACGMRKQSRMAQNLGTLIPCRIAGKRFLDPSLGIAFDVALTLGVNHWTEDLPFCLSSSLYIWLSNK